MSDAQKVVPLFRRRLREVVPEAPLPPSVGFGGNYAPRAPIAASKVDLSGKPKVWCLMGSGSSGKSLTARWLFWRMAEQGRQAELAALDPGKRSLATWFDAVSVPETRNAADTAHWLVDFLDFIASEKRTAILDFGGGDTNLALALAMQPDLAERLAADGVAMVACYLLPPRPDDMAIVRDFEDAGFQPEATVLLLNEGRKDSSLGADEAFAPILNHSVFKKVIGRGAAALWLPALEPDVMQEIETKRLDFGQARDGKVPDGASFYPLGGLRRSMVGRWLGRLEDCFAGAGSCATWLP